MSLAMHRPRHSNILYVMVCSRLKTRLGTKISMIYIDDIIIISCVYHESTIFLSENIVKFFRFSKN